MTVIPAERADVDSDKYRGKREEDGALEEGWDSLCSVLGRNQVCQLFDP